MSSYTYFMPGLCSHEHNTHSHVGLNEVPCPSCLDPMYLSNNQLVSVFLHHQLQDNSNELEVMCSDCIKERLEDFAESKYMNKIRIFNDK